MILITESNKSALETWYARAMADDSVWPFMSFGKWATFAKVGRDDWSEVVVMDDSQNAVLEWTHDRASGMHSASVCLWSLSGTKQAISAGRLCQAMDGLAKRYGVSWIDAACHESNSKSRYILDERFGQPWGRKPDGAWNGKTGAFEYSLHYRVFVG